MNVTLSMLREKWAPVATAESLAKVSKQNITAGWEPSAADEFDQVFECFSQNATPGPPRASSLAVWVNKVVSGRVLLLGDAAHCLSPKLGLGMNMGLEDVSIFGAFLTGKAPSDEVLEKKPGSLAQAIETHGKVEGTEEADLTDILNRFEKWRLPEMRAAVTLTHQRVVLDTGFPWFENQIWKL